MDLPLSLTAADLQNFNQFWQSLSADDRQAMNDMIAATRPNWPALTVHGNYLTYQAFLLMLVMEQQKEIRRLRELLDALEAGQL